MKHVNEFGYEGLPDEPGYGYDGMIAGLGAFTYVPNLQPVGNGSSYYPGDTTDDAMALNFVGMNPDGTNNYYSDESLMKHVGTTGSQQGDMAQEAGAWESYFRDAVMMFQRDAGLPDDGWIGPMTRTALAAAVARKSADGPPIVPPMPNILPIPPPPLPGPRPSPAPEPPPVADKKDNTTTYLAIGGAALLVVGVGYALSK